MAWIVVGGRSWAGSIKHGLGQIGHAAHACMPAIPRKLFVFIPAKAGIQWLCREKAK
jgi:hypothetical protein